MKLNEGFSGEGNANFGFEGAPGGGGLEGWIRSRLPALAFEVTPKIPIHAGIPARGKILKNGIVHDAKKMRAIIQCQIDMAALQSF